MRLSFREARAEDLPAVVALLADDALGAAREREDMAIDRAAFEVMQAEAANHLYVGEDGNGRVVGTYQLTLISGLSLAASRRAQVESVRIASDLRGQGLGQQMFADIEARARAAGCRLIQLTMNASRSDSRRFYSALGFEPSHVGFKRYLD